MTEDIKIFNLDIIKPQDWDCGDKCIAMFDCEVHGIRIRRCLLLWTARKFALAQLPRGNSKREGQRLFKIVEPALAHGLSQAAFVEFERLGGRVEEDAAA